MNKRYETLDEMVGYFKAQDTDFELGMKATDTEIEESKEWREAIKKQQEVKEWKMNKVWALIVALFVLFVVFSISKAYSKFKLKVVKQKQKVQLKYEELAVAS